MSNTKAPTPLKIYFFSLDGAGHLNACVGMAQPLMKRGHVVKFLLNETFAGQYGKYGFEEIILRQQPTEAGSASSEKADKKNPFKDIAEQVAKSGVMSAKSPLEKLKEQNASKPASFMAGVVDTLVWFDPQIENILSRDKPDVFILDHFFVPPALQKSTIPWLCLTSGNPLNLYQSDKLPPFGGGYPTDSDPESWKEYSELSKARFASVSGSLQERLDTLCGYTPAEEVGTMPAGTFTGKSKFLNIYGYPEELDYQDIVPIPDRFARVDAFCLDSPDVFVLPDHFNVGPGEKLIYVSLGSMGSVIVELMKRITSVLGKSPHKFIVSKGPLADQYELPSNCWGEAFLPQTRILPLVDLVITHGGNNTITETFSFGKPMIVMPMMGDQYDNAQRVFEKQYGVRLDAHGFKDEELLEAVDKLLTDKEMIQRCKKAAERIQTSNSKELVCKKIEQVVADLKSKTEDDN